MTKLRALQRNNGGAQNITGGKGLNTSPPVAAYNRKGVYRPLQSKCGNNDDYLDSQFQKPPIQVPIKAIAFATFLCMVGSILFILGLLVCTGYIDSKFSDRVWPMIIMGLLMFIPGAYHVRIAYFAYQGIPGFSFEDIPEFDWMGVQNINVILTLVFKIDANYMSIIRITVNW